jgi:CheY-like chemotaxis protein/anti-sigma regulatory factor (Ser/Thr protein kinase)
VKKILVVEDDRATRVLLTQILKGEGYPVAEAKNGALALARLREEKFDLVLLDIWMPHMNGLELLARLRAEEIGVKAIVMTSDDTPSTLLRAVREQAYHYLTKPVEPAKLIEMVGDALAASPVPPIEVLSALPGWVELLVPCEVGAAERIQSFMALMDAGLPPEVRESIGLVFHEMLMNAIEWGGKLDPNSKVRISYLRAKRMVLYRIADPGPGFKLEQLAHAAVSYPTEQMVESANVRQQMGLRPGGFGILMSGQMVDELLYNEARNEVVFVKYLE